MFRELYVFYFTRVTKKLQNEGTRDDKEKNMMALESEKTKAAGT